ncbi:Processive diacylglycerol beta-glucosyltransferase [Kordia antarctica]|uniref:Processive diacylglycerol beta-glucosyltransferase n=1 Tax=Kordia antarctica TaxID=1218801 RepID=A0A7L4ZGT5_9FLAO|nr:hypothetical protein [Kordia antarctica]QHI35466.1 Processive diacylglycerol beta-glucosyltransferase [Kordia antarctica]
MSKKIAAPKVLTSLFGFGVYFPARITANSLKTVGFDSEVLLIEHLFTDAKRKTFEASKIAFSKNYKLAKLATKLSVDSSDMFDPDKVEILFKRWEAAKVSEFLCFSGLWLDLLSLYSKSNPQLSVKLCRLDAGDAVTWRMNDEVAIQETYSFLDLNEGKINYKLSIPTLHYIPFGERKQSVVIHGGGWGLGNFLETTQQLPENLIKRILVKDFSKYVSQKKNTTFYMNDPNWDPINNGFGVSHFPRLGEIISTDTILYSNNNDYHSALDLIVDSKAIISKPGGMTIVDSIITGTPLIYLDPMGENEKGNQILIERLKIGASFTAWQHEKFSIEMLLEFHENIERIKIKLPELTSKIIADLKK